MNDPINHPSHYTQGGIECIEAIQAALTPDEFVGYLKGQILKYTWCSGHKNDIVQDTSKGIWYAQRLISFVESQRQPMCILKSPSVSPDDERHDDKESDEPVFTIWYFPIKPFYHLLKGLEGIENWGGPAWYIIRCDEYGAYLGNHQYAKRETALQNANQEMWDIWKMSIPLDKAP